MTYRMSEIRHEPMHTYPGPNGDLIAPERWSVDATIESSHIYGHDIRLTVTGARSGIVRLQADLLGPYRAWSEPPADLRRAVVDAVLASTGRRRVGRQMPDSHPSVGWRYTYMTEATGQE